MAPRCCRKRGSVPWVLLRAARSLQDHSVERWQSGQYELLISVLRDLRCISWHNDISSMFPAASSPIPLATSLPLSLHVQLVF